MWKAISVQIEDKMVVAMRQRTRGRKERRCSESDGRGDEGEAKERATILNTEIRQIKTYGDEVNNPINDYMSEEMDAPSRGIRPARGRARCAWRDLTRIEGRVCVVRRR